MRLGFRPKSLPFYTCWLYSQSSGETDGLMNVKVRAPADISPLSPTPCISSCHRLVRQGSILDLNFSFVSGWVVHSRKYLTSLNLILHQRNGKNSVRNKTSVKHPANHAANTWKLGIINHSLLLFPCQTVPSQVDVCPDPGSLIGANLPLFPAMGSKRVAWSIRPCGICLNCPSPYKLFPVLVFLLRASFPGFPKKIHNMPNAGRTALWIQGRGHPKHWFTWPSVASVQYVAVPTVYFCLKVIQLPFFKRQTL